MIITGLGVISVISATAATAQASDPKEKKESPKLEIAAALSAQTRHQTNQSIDKAIEFLKATQQKDGSWQNDGQSDPAITALAAKCFMQHPQYGPDHKIVNKAMTFLLTFKKEDGGIYPQGYGLRNYYTSICLMALASSNNPAFQQHIDDAQNFLKKLQWDGEEDIDENNAWYGGTGYGKHKRPDLSNTQMMLEALKQSGLSPDDPAFKKALKFIERCQMSSHINDPPFARGANDGGFIYTPANQGESKAGTVIEEGKPRLRTYGSMTYAGFKSYLYANLDKNDPRVQAAFNWIRQHYTLDQNPNMPGKQSLEGLYYYFHVFAKALHAWGETTIVDSNNIKHNWREDLSRKLQQLQNKDGSWVNPADRWYEGNPYLVTAYSVLALQTSLK